MSPSDTESANGGTSTISRIWPVVRKNRMELREHVVGVMYLKGEQEVDDDDKCELYFCYQMLVAVIELSLS